MKLSVEMAGGYSPMVYQELRSFPIGNKIDDAGRGFNVKDYGTYTWYIISEDLTVNFEL